jgi:uncharacterized protein
MTTTLVLSFVVMLIVIAGMAVGVMFGRKPIAGSCGGMKALGVAGECAICGGNPAACESTSAADGAASRDPAQSLARDAARGRRTL